MAETTIEWTGRTWNPLRGCTRVSPGCQNCYAERMAARFSGPGMAFEGLAKMTPHGPRWTGAIRLLPEVLNEPLRWRKPQTVFVNSMSDLFHKDVPFDFIDKVFATMALTPQHTYQILTKRPDRMREYLTAEGVAARISDAAKVISEQTGMLSSVEVMWIGSMGEFGDRWILKQWPLKNVQLGTSVENQECADKRTPELLKCPAVVHFLSCEPLLGELDLIHITEDEGGSYGDSELYLNALTGDRLTSEGLEYVLSPLRVVSWVIAGAESGPGARPMKEDWVRSLRDQCVAAGTKFFFKQRLDERGHKVSLPELDGRVWDEMPQR